MNEIPLSQNLIALSINSPIFWQAVDESMCMNMVYPSVVLQ